MVETLKSALESQFFRQIPRSWHEPVAAAMPPSAWTLAAASLAKAQAADKTVYPPAEQRFLAFAVTPLEKVRVVILGQDPYHGPGQAMGLSFSVPKGQALPPSLRNIFKELSSDLKLPVPTSGDLTPWAKQGVLLLNTVLVVNAGEAASHAKAGWEKLTHAALAAVAAKPESVAFILWGSHAQKQVEHLDMSRHLVLKDPHPSPLSAHRGFFGSRPFSKVNQFLVSHGEAPIDWQLP